MRQVGQGLVKFFLGAGLEDLELQPEGARCILRILDLDLGNGRVLGNPVTLPPGRAILVTSPTSTGSLPVVKTIGIVVVAFFAASAAGVLVAAMTATRRLIRSAAKSGRRS